VGNLFEELKRRKVFRVAGVYAVVAWLLIEVADTVLPTFGTPLWVNQTLIFLLIIGFPIAVILAWAYEVTPEGIRPDNFNQLSGTSAAMPSSDRKLIYATFGLVLLVAGFQIADRFLLNIQPLANLSSSGSIITDVARVSLPVGEGRSLYLGGRDASFGRPAATSLAFSNDGRLLVYSGWEPGSRGARSQLYSRPLDQERAQPINGTQGGSSPFLSPDNNWIGFYGDNSLRRIPITGGIAQTIVAPTESDNMEIYGASWGDNNRIVYADQVPGSEAAPRRGLYLVEASGGSGVLLADPIESQGQFSSYTQPHMLPGGKHLLFQGMAGNGDPERAEIIALDIASGTRTTLLSNAMNPRYVAETGTLLFMRQGLLMAVGFDPAGLTLMGEPVVIAENVMQALNMRNTSVNTGVGQLAISAAGHLVYVRGGVTPAGRTTLARVTVDGQAEPLNSFSQTTPSASFMRLSPDGTRLAYNATSPQGNSVHVHVHDLVRNVSHRMNSGGYRSMNPVWSPDSESLLMSSNREDNVGNIYRMRVDGSDERPERLAPSEQGQTMQSVSIDGVIAWLQNGDIWTLPPGGEPAPFFTSDAQEAYATFSGDGRWLAYSSRTTDSTRDGDLYIRPYPGPGRAILIASGRSSASAWSRDSTQLYFIETDRDTSTVRMMVADITNGVPSPVRPLIDPWPYRTTVVSRNFDVLEDGSFITSIGSSQDNNDTELEDLAVAELQVVFNFFELLRRQ
jgi:Tol biopolymer transport system component